MDFDIVDTQSAYRRLLDEPDAAAREAIFRSELIAPFDGLVQFFGGDGPAVFRQWGMTVEPFAPERRASTAALVEALAAGDAWQRAALALEKGWAAFAAHVYRIPLNRVVFGLYIADLSGTPQAHGYTGFGGIPGWILTVYGSADAYNLARVEAATVHELHHNILGASRPQAVNMLQVTVGEYMVNEGLAESFAAALYGPDMVGPWVSEFDEADLERTRAAFREGLEATGFDQVQRYIFGDPQAGLPVYAGYALGYRLVQAYLARSGKSVVEATFVPAKTILANSRFFD